MLRKHRSSLAKGFDYPEVIEKEVQVMMELGVIERFQSEWHSPAVLVPKPDGTLRKSTPSLNSIPN